MCGFVGVLGGRGLAEVATGETALKSMADAIVRRGPDDAGYWHDPDNRIGLGHRRLAIIDLSQAGHQPMLSASGRYVIAFNGEIYNYVPLREALAQQGYDPAWRGHSDTEVLLAGFDFWGIRETLEKCVGMFAFAVWDRQEKRLTLARDRIGEKPAYFGWQGDTFLFGSELKALRAHSAFEASVDRDALCLLLRHNHVPAPYSIYQGIHKLQPGCLLTVSAIDPEPQISRYWSAEDVFANGSGNPFAGTAEQAVDHLEDLLKSAVGQQMVADVPLGAFLSGGIDSSLVVALMQSLSDRPVKTFSIGFNEDGYNEAVHAKSVASYLQTDHTELYVSPQQALSVIPELPKMYCEPFADSSQIPTFLVAQLARQHVSVSLSGDGGDELFCGYTRYKRTRDTWELINKLPRSLRPLLAGSLRLLPVRGWDMFASMYPGKSTTSLGDRLHKFSHIMNCASFDEFYLNFLMSHHRDPASLVLAGDEPPTLMSGNRPKLEALGKMQRMMAIDQMTYLPDDILVKVDRAAMAVSLETRVPLLDHRVVEFASTIPQEIKNRDGQFKWPLRQVLYRHVDRELIERPKMGFGVPIESWLRGPLKDWGENLLGHERLRTEGFLNPEPIRQMWREHLSGERRWHNQLWDVLMFQAWLDDQNES
ncbi:MAG: asparagine synthase (glutamine-hydrolyzing) [Gammaproteobacteria bacterium]|nr:asparagine synthase (glutamine-hydrolyzing) [Gammaproteobacteria bacterium]